MQELLQLQLGYVYIEAVSILLHFFDGVALPPVRTAMTFMERHVTCCAEVANVMENVWRGGKQGAVCCGARGAHKDLM